MKIMKPETRGDDASQTDGQPFLRVLRSERVWGLLAIAVGAGSVWLTGCGGSDSSSPANTAGSVSFAGSGNSTSSAGAPTSGGGDTSSGAGSDGTAGSSTAGTGGTKGTQPPKVGGACSDMKMCAAGLTCEPTADGKGECSKACTADTDCVMGSVSGVCASDKMCHLPCTPAAVAPATICKRMGWVCDPGGVYCVAPAGSGGSGGASSGGSDSGGASSGGSDSGGASSGGSNSGGASSGGGGTAGLGA